VPAGLADPNVIPRHDELDTDPAVIAAIAAVGRSGPRHHLQCACGCADLFERREGRWREDLVADARDDGSIAFAVLAHFVPSRIVLECGPSRFPICKRVPREYVGQLIA
jgi:hypothetical protein